MFDDDRITDYHIDQGWWDVTRAGKWEGYQGGRPAEVEITLQDLKDMVATYGPQIMEAPVTLDHWESGEAFGWIKELRISGDKLQARLKLVSDQMREWLKSGAYRSRSIKMFKPLSSTGKPYLGHLAFLGAANPAAEGLEPVPYLFAQDGGQATMWTEAKEKGQAVSIEAQNNQSSTEEKSIMDESTMIQKITDNLKSWFSSRDDQSAQLKAVNDKLAELEKSSNQQAAELKAQTERADKAEAELAGHTEAAALAGFEGKLDAAVKDQKLTPPEVENFKQLGKSLDAAGRTKIIELVEARKPSGLFAEHSGLDPKEAAAASKAERAEKKFDGFPEDPEHSAAMKLMAADPELKFEAALAEVRLAKVES